MRNTGITVMLMLAAMLGLALLAGCPAGDDGDDAADQGTAAATPAEAETSPQVEQLELAAEQQSEAEQGAKPRHPFDPNRPLNDQYSDMKANSDIPEETRQVLSDQIQTLADMEMENDALKPGDQAPGFMLPTDDGDAISLDEALANGPAVLVFFRGGW